MIGVPVVKQRLAIREAITFKHASPFLEVSSSPKRSSKALSWSMMKPCTRMLLINMSSATLFHNVKHILTTWYHRSHCIMMGGTIQTRLNCKSTRDLEWSYLAVDGEKFQVHLQKWKSYNTFMYMGSLNTTVIKMNSNNQYTLESMEFSEYTPLLMLQSGAIHSNHSWWDQPTP